MSLLCRRLTWTLCVASLLCLLQGCLHNASAQQQNKHERIEITGKSFIARSDICPGLTISIGTASAGLAISTGKANVFIPPLDGQLPSEIFIGDFWSNDRCFVAVESNSGFVNASYDLYRLDQVADSGEAPLQVLVNPEFGSDRIISTYRDGARWHEESLCFSGEADRSYICERRINVDEEIQRYRSCDHLGICSNSILVKKGGEEGINATIQVQRAHSYRMPEEGRLEVSRSYLIKGDKVALLDFVEYDGRLFYKFSYGKGSAMTIGWVLSEVVAIDR